MSTNAYQKILIASEKAYAELARFQCLDQKSLDYGGYIDPKTGYCEPAKWGSAMGVSLGCALYCCPESKYFQDSEVLKRAKLFFTHTKAGQHEDGTWDLRSSNYHDATASAFTIVQLLDSYQLLCIQNCQEDFANDILCVCKKAGQALLYGGFHTPNHRWVIASALSMLYQETQEEAYKQVAELYLKEGIDCHADGSYTEKSVGNYDAVVDQALITIAQTLDRPQYLQLVLRNLSMVAYMVQPDGYLCTNHSFRQDRGARIKPMKYYLVYRDMARKTRDPLCQYMAEKIANECLDELNTEGPSYDFLTPLLLDAELREDCLSLNSPLVQGVHAFLDMGMIRVLKNGVAITLLRDNAQFLHIQKGSLSVYFRLYASFFSRGQFKAQRIEETDELIILRMRVKYGYIRPFEHAVETSNWSEMPHGTWANIEAFNTKGLYPKWEEIDFGQRKAIGERFLDFTISLDRNRLLRGEISMHLQVQGTDRVPLNLECVFDLGGDLSSDSCIQKNMNSGSIIARKGEWTYTKGCTSFTLGPCFSTHTETQLRGQADADSQGFAVFCTAETPLDTTIYLV